MDCEAAAAPSARSCRSHSKVQAEAVQATEAAGTPGRSRISPLDLNDQDSTQMGLSRSVTSRGNCFIGEEI